MAERKGISHLMDSGSQIATPQSSDPYRGTLGTFGKPVLGLVTGFDFVTNDRGELLKDDDGNSIPTGLLEIKLLEKLGSRSKVPYVLPAAGNTLFIGGLPEVGTVCVVLFRQQDAPIIVGFLPHGLDRLKQQRQQIPHLQPGEVLLQSSAAAVDVDANENFFRGARIHLDRYGRVKIEAQGYELVTNYLLSNEQRNDVTQLQDPVTGNPVFFSEVLADQLVSRRVDSVGNAVNSYARDLFEKIGGNRDEETEGRHILTAKQGINLQDDKGNQISLGTDGKWTLATNSSFDQALGGTWKMATGGNVEMNVALRRQVTVGEDDVVQVAGNLVRQIALDHEMTVSTGDSMEDIIVGRKIISAALSILLQTEGILTLESNLAVLAGQLVQLGSKSATQPMVLGLKNAVAMAELVTIIGPVLDVIAAGTSAVLATWQLKNFVTPATSVNSFKVLGE